MEYLINMLAYTKYDFDASLSIMWKGMVGIFVVLIIISFIVYILSKLTKDKNSD